MKEEKEKKINFKYNWNQYVNFLKKYRWKIWGLLLMVIMTESLFVVDKFLFKRLIDDGEMFLSGTLGYEPFINVLIVIAIIFIFILISRSITKWITENIVIKFEGNLIKDLKKKYFDHIIGLSHEFHSTHKTGSLISRLGRGAHAIESLTDNLLYNFAPLVLQLILVSFSIALFSLNSAIVLFFVTVIFIGYSYYLQKLQAPFKLAHNSAEDSEKGFVSDIFMNIDSIKYFGKERRIKYKFEKTLNNTRSKLIKDYSYYRWMSSGQMFILGIGTLFLIYFPIKEFLAGQITLGTLVFIYTIYGNIAGNLFGFVFGIRNFYRAMADFQNLFEYGKIENEIKDKSNANDLKIEKGEIEFKNISFNYDKRKLFSNFNLKIKENEKIALVGHSGCGKSTLIKLLNRFYDVSKGVILIDGVNIKNIKQESLREETGIVPQEAILFDDTIYNNIKFANNKASRKQILKAMKFAQLDKIVKNFPKGLQTIVGERGVKLSGGEKQRVSIARAILANKKILVLDEATSALDSETEHEIQKDFQKLLRGRTSIIIAHRLSTIMNADRIIVLKEGKIVQQGKHKDLIKRKGEYVKLWDLQKGGYVLD